MSTADERKRRVEDFLRTAFEQGEPEAAVRRHVGAKYVQHGAGASPGKEGFVAFAGAVARDHPDLRIDIRRILADGDLVAVHFWLTGLGDGPGHAVVDIFRLDADGRIVEHWDVMQAIAPGTADPGRLF